MLDTKVRVRGHYEVIETAWAVDYVWVPGEEEIEARFVDEVLNPWHAAYEECERERRAHPEKQEWLELRELG